MCWPSPQVNMKPDLHVCRADAERLVEWDKLLAGLTACAPFYACSRSVADHYHQTAFFCCPSLLT